MKITRGHDDGSRCPVPALDDGGGPTAPAWPSTLRRTGRRPISRRLVGIGAAAPLAVASLIAAAARSVPLAVAAVGMVLAVTVAWMGARVARRLSGVEDRARTVLVLAAEGGTVLLAAALGGIAGRGVGAGLDALVGTDWLASAGAGFVLAIAVALRLGTRREVGLLLVLALALIAAGVAVWGSRQIDLAADEFIEVVVVAAMAAVGLSFVYLGAAMASVAILTRLPGRRRRGDGDRVSTDHR